MPFSVKKKMYSLLGKVTQKYINKYIYIYMGGMEERCHSQAKPYECRTV